MTGRLITTDDMQPACSHMYDIVILSETILGSDQSDCNELRIQTPKDRTQAQSHVPEAVCIGHTRLWLRVTPGGGRGGGARFVLVYRLPPGQVQNRGKALHAKPIAQRPVLIRIHLRCDGG